ncbi:ABC transporter permease subunit [Sinorhizobium meliloti]|uniref:ABC transporter permease n=1 Tax=Rhizobium meliloti TaxID=382 RepID=UPI003F16019C
MSTESNPAPLKRPAIAGGSTGWAATGLVLLVLVAWFWATTVGGVSPITLPNPVDVIRVLPEVIMSKIFILDLATTLAEIAVAFVAAAISAVSVGYFVSQSQTRTMEFEPLLSAAYAIPILLFYPLIVLLVGIGPMSKIVLGFGASFFPITLSTIAGFSGVNKTLLRSARSMGASRAQLLRYVLLPSALPVVATGLRMGLIFAMLAVLGGETLGSVSGIGYRMINFAEQMETTKTYAYIILVVLLALCLNLLASALERQFQTRREA